MDDIPVHKLAGMLDHSLLQPTSTDAELEAGCLLARRLAVASVCILPHALPRCVQLLEGSGVEPSTTIGFPHGATSTRAKEREAALALGDGATELDMVVNIGKVLSRDFVYVRADIQAVLDVTHDRGQKLKVIFENCYLEDTHKIALCEICSDLQVDWVKTSTGFGPSGATSHDVRLMAMHTPESVQVKAAGGIRTLPLALQMIALGATRIGTSRSESLLREAADSRQS